MKLQSGEICPYCGRKMTGKHRKGSYEEAALLRARGQTYQQIADQFHISRMSAYRWVQLARPIYKTPDQRFLKAVGGEDNLVIDEEAYDSVAEE
jgi:hypothetical protein